MRAVHVNSKVAEGHTVHSVGGVGSAPAIASYAVDQHWLCALLSLCCMPAARPAAGIHPGERLAAFTAGAGQREAAAARGA